MPNTNVVKTLIHRGTGGQQGWIYDINYICPCIPASTYKDPVKLVILRGSNDKQENRYDSQKT